MICGSNNIKRVFSLPLIVKEYVEVKVKLVEEETRDVALHHVAITEYVPDEDLNTLSNYIIKNKL